ncbi:MAG TPA: TolC family protein [Thermoanaerobaculia bacterium]|nr:TolC family protein [Thermoanaerobaculia bacterium]
MSRKKKSVVGRRQSEKKLTADSLQLTARAKAAMLALLLCRGLAGAQGLPEAPLTLRRAAERALARAPEVAVARAQVDEAAAGVRAAKAAFGPQAFATTTPGYSNGLPVAVAGRVPSVFGVELHQTIYDPAKRSQAFDEEARAAVVAAGLLTSGSATARALVLAYGRNWADQISIADAREVLETREAAHRRVAALGREGRTTPLEVERAGLEVARAKQTLLDRETEADLDRLELARLIGWSSSDPIPIAEDPLAVLPVSPPGDFLAAARAADPQLNALEAEAAALEKAVFLQKRAWLPVIQAEGQYLRLSNYNNFDQYFVKFKANDLAVGISVVVPLWTGGRLSHAQVAAEARLGKARADRMLRDRDLELDVRRAQGELTRAQARLALTVRAEALARETLRVGKALAVEGRAEPDELDKQTIAAGEARDDRIKASQQLLAARAKVLELRGELPGALLADAPIAEAPKSGSSSPKS